MSGRYRPLTRTRPGRVVDQRHKSFHDGFYYEKVLGGIRKFYFIERPQRERPLPIVLSEQEVARLFNVTENLKHKCLLMLIYSAGLRVSEALNMKIKDIDSQRMQVLVRSAKGGKDRVSQTGTAYSQKVCCHFSGSTFSCTSPRTTFLREKEEGLIHPGVRRACSGRRSEKQRSESG